ncbi:MAG: hypothetical protein M4579_005144 [Chaenotheca gracillima]|nr:MAG: hypothetical protein M4579_005144 [Chaenotheca gracillima]
MGQSGSTHKISAQDKAILDMKNQRDRLHQYQKKVTLLTDREMAVAREMIARGDKARALLALRRKKYQETLLAKTDAQLEQLEKLTSNVEFALVQKDVVFGLQQGTAVLKEIHHEMGGIENVDKLMGENEEAVAYQKVGDTGDLWKLIFDEADEEISEMLGGRMSNQDEDEVEDELDALAEQVPSPPIPSNLLHFCGVLIWPTQMSGTKTKLPDVPEQELPQVVDVAADPTRDREKARARARAREQAASQAAEPMLA